MLSSKQFFKAARSELGEFMTSHGFSLEGSRRAVFHRFVSKSVCHVVAPFQMMRLKELCRIMVGPTSPIIDPDFGREFPDFLSAVSDDCFLSVRHGISREPDEFHCGEVDHLRQAFSQQIRPALEFAFKRLDGFREVGDFLKIRDLKDHQRGLVLLELDRFEKAMPFLRRGLAFFEGASKAEKADPKVAAWTNALLAGIAKCESELRSQQAPR